MILHAVFSEPHLSCLPKSGSEGEYQEKSVDVLTHKNYFYKTYWITGVDVILSELIKSTKQKATFDNRGSLPAPEELNIDSKLKQITDINNEINPKA
jgi:hypothetical protein